MSNISNHRVDPICDGLDGIYSTAPHVGAIFVMFFASIIGSGFPLYYGKRVDTPEYVYILGKCFGTGVMVAVGFVHLLGDAAQNFRVWCVPIAFTEAYEAWAFFLAVVAVVLMHLIDIAIADLINPLDPKSEAKEALWDSYTVHGTEEHWTENDELSGSGHAKVGDLLSCTDGGQAFHHQHGAPAEPHFKSKAQFAVAAVCMEFSMTLHSLFVGVDVGVMSDTKVKPILIALVLHQMFEGLAVGWRIADSSFNKSVELIMMLVFSFAAPLGAVVGAIFISISKTALTGATYVLFSSFLDSLCGGILVYLGVTLMLTDFPADVKRLCAAGTPYAMRKKLGLFAGLWMGAAGMCFIGKWC